MASTCTRAGRKIVAFPAEKCFGGWVMMAVARGGAIGRWVRRSSPGLRSALFVLIAHFISVPAWAVVTYDGDQGVRANIFNSNSSERCLNCHHSSLSSGSRSSAPLGVDFDTYANAIASDNEVRAVVRAVDQDNMPPAGALSGPEQTLLQGWENGGYLKNAPPDVDTHIPSAVTKYSANLHGDANENGLNSTFHFQYATNSSFIGSSTATPNPNFISGTGGGTEGDTFFSVNTGSVLSCGTLYYYRIRTSSGASAIGDTVTFTTDACPSITNPPSNESITEGELKQHDVNATGGPVTFSLENQPTGMSIDSLTGLISWTPGEVVTSGTVTVRISDGTTEDTAPFEWTVNSINDPPMISSTAPNVALETIEYQYDVVVNDPDDTIGGLTFSLSGEPAGMTIDSMGRIRWTPGIGQSDVGPITVTVADGGEDGADPDMEVFSITINAPDGDGDGHADYDDNCPSTANAGQSDTDGDGIGDACDPDEEGDGTFDSAIEFTVTQSGQNGVFLARTAGTVTVGAALEPEIVGLDPVWDWSGTDSAILGLASFMQTDTAPTTSTGGESEISFNPASLPIGQHEVDLVATSGSVSTHTSITLDVRAGGSAPEDADDDGVPDSNDGFVGGNVVNGTGNGSPAQQIEVNGSARLRVGATVLAASASRASADALGALLTGSEVELLIGKLGQLDGRTNSGGWFDFEVRGLLPGASAKVVLPLQSALRQNAVYMKYRAGTGWQEFSTADGNSVASALRTGGMCPGPNDSGWTGGLSAFDECIRLTIVDGGPNDADGEKNGVIVDPGGAVAAADSSGGSDPVDGGGGAVGLKTLFALLIGGALLLTAGWRRKDESA